MCIAWDVTTVLDGTIIKLRIFRRNTRKASILSACLETDTTSNVSGTGKYLLEREKLVKENAWQLNE